MSHARNTAFVYSSDTISEEGLTTAMFVLLVAVTLHGMYGTLHGMYGTLHGMYGTLHGMYGTLHGMYGTLHGMYGRDCYLWHALPIKSHENVSIVSKVVIAGAAP
jgi:hypothetical protein